MSSKIFTSKIYNFENLPEPKNATEDNDSKESPRLSKKLKIENDVQNDYEREFMQRQSNISINDEVQNNPNLHSDEKDKQETPNAKVDKEKINMNSKSFTSKIYIFENLSEPKNATEASNLSKSSNRYIPISSNGLFNY
ncbi:hypothetical protein RhiirC2_720426 [Rhizophagus irregularis]|uniref:Uncharacterized protein n=1 Tax=Rhizophagus irregularis TaxID=588596 RepID=A0A2N1MAA5_9GLOM|nr:hypothetical protein RhiirC2_720426 [Rhizophagus irregularis]